MISSGLIAAVLVTGALYLVGGTGGSLLDSQERRRVSKETHGYYGGYYSAHGQGDRWGRRQDSVLHKMGTILSFLSVESLQVFKENCLKSHNTT